MEEGAYLAWKRAQVVAALHSRGLDAEVEGVRPVLLGGRRRASLALSRGKEGVALGYHRARSRDLIDIAVCPVLSPRIVARLRKLKQVLAPLLVGKREAKVDVTETDRGLDIAVDGVRPTPAAMAAFAGQAAAVGVARLTVDGESIAMGGAPEVYLSGAKVRLPPAAFLQASREAEVALESLCLRG